MQLSFDNQRELKRMFRKELKDEVNIRLFSQSKSPLILPGRDCATCVKTEELLNEVVALSPKLHLQTFDFFTQLQDRDINRVERIPAIVIGKGDESRVKFYGFPGGYEFALLLEVIKHISRGVSPLSVNTRKRLRKVDKEVHIQVLVVPSKERSLTLAMLAQAVALENPLIHADVIQAHEFSSLARFYQVTSVSKAVINDISELVGQVTEEDFVDRVLQMGVEKSYDDSLIEEGE